MRQNSILHGRYLIGRVLGQGGFGITYIAFDLVLDIKVAIKEYFPMGIAARDPGSSNTLLWHSTQMNTEQRKNGQESFLKEARRIAKIDQIPSIVRVRDTFFDNETAYIVMDYVEGITLKDKLQKSGAISSAECLRLLGPLMKGMEAVHRTGIIHRDISPDNIIIQADGSVKLLDLGAAKDISTGQGQQSQLVAKKGFSPLEQYTENGRIGPWTDVYGFCATIYYCVTGRMIPNALDRLGHEEIIFPEGMKEPLPDHIKATLKEGLALEAAKRIQSMEELLSRLGGGNPQTDQTAGQIRPQPDQRAGAAEVKVHKPRKRMVWIGAAAAALVGIFIAIGLNWGGDQDDGFISASSPHNVSYGTETGTDTGTETDTGMGTDTGTGSGTGTEADAGGYEDVPVVETLGTSNANMTNYGGDATFSGKYEYYIAADNALYICAYNQEDGTFYLDEGEKVCDYAGYITLSGDKVYFVATVDEAETVCQMDQDGSNILQVYTAAEKGTVRYLQYAQFSDGREYLYFVVDHDAEGSGEGLYRCDLGNNETEVVVEGDLYWYNLYGDSIYYTEFTDSSIELSRTGLDGGDKQVLDSDRQFGYGFAAEDTLYMYSLRDEALLACNLDGTQKSGYEGFYQLEIDFSFGVGYGDGWIFYTGTDGNIHKARENGTGDSVLLEGISALAVCYDKSWLWLFDRQPAEKNHQYRDQIYMAYKDGSNLFDVKETDYNWGLPTAYGKDFQYETAEDGEGIIITGYTGSLTSFEIPEEIEGQTVVAIGDEAFQGSAAREIALPQGLREIGSYAFYQCGELDFVGLPEGLETIGVAAFGECGKLTEIELPESLKEICNLAFAESALSRVHIPANVELIGTGAFAVVYSAGFTEFTVDSENGLYVSREGALYEKAFDSFDNPLPGEVSVLISVPSGITGSFSIPDGVVILSPYAFAHCKGLTEVAIPASVKEIGENVFFGAEIEIFSVSEECQLPSDCGFALSIEYY